MEKPAFATFYKTHVDRVYRFVLLRVGGQVQVAEDLTSDVFIKALRAYGEYDPKQSVSAWIYTIARNTLANHYRDTAKESDADILEIPLAANDFLSGVLKEEDRLRVHRALAALDPEKRQLIDLKYLQGYRYEEMAAILGKTATAVKVATHRAMKLFTETCSRD